MAKKPKKPKMSEPVRNYDKLTRPTYIKTKDPKTGKVSKHKTGGGLVFVKTKGMFRKPKKDNNAVRGKEVTIRDSSAPAQVIYGEMRVGGVVTMIHSASDSSAYIQTGEEESNNMLVWTMKASGDAGNQYTLRIVNPGVPNHPTTDCSIVDKNITITLKTNGVGGGVEISDLNNVIAAVQGNPTVNDLITVQKSFSGTNGYVDPIGVTSFANGGGSVIHQIITLAGHEIDSVQKLYLDDTEVVFGASPDPRWATGRFGDYRVFMAVNYGGDDQTAQPDCIGQIPHIWTADHRQRGNAHVFLILRYNETVFPEGMPEIQFLVRGKKVYDPRTMTSYWSQNAALIINDYITNPRYGVGCLDVDAQVLIDAAVVCDGVISIAAGGTERRYSFNTAFDPTQGHESIIDQMAQGMAGNIFSQNGKVFIHPGAYRSPAVTFTIDDFRSEVSFTTSLSRDDIFNYARGTYISTVDFQETDIPAQRKNPAVDISVDPYVVADGSILYQDFPLNFVTSVTQAQRILRIELEKARQGIIVSASLKLSGLLVDTGDTVNINLPEYGWTPKVFEVISAEEVFEDDFVIGVDLELRETAAGIYDWNTSLEATVDLAPNTTLPSATDVGEPTNVIAESGTAQLYFRGDGTVQSRVKVSWTPSAAQFVFSGGKYQIRHKLTSEGNWANAIAVNTTVDSASFFYLLDVQDGQTYNIQVRALNTIGFASDWISAADHTVVGKEAVPINVAGFTAARTDFGIVFSWTDINEIDLREYEIRVGASWAAGTALYVGKGIGYRWEHKTAGTYNFWIKARDTSNHESTDAARAGGADFVIALPANPTVSTAVEGKDAKLSWTAATGDFAIKEYEIRYGTSFAVGTFVAIVTARNYVIPVSWGGSRTFWVAARDIALNTGTGANASVEIDNPNPVQSLEVTTIDNNVMLDWDDPASGDLPIAEYKIYKGAIFSGATLIGTVYGSFHTYLEKVGGEFIYWVVAIDTAGNASSEVSYAATVRPPDDYVIRSNLEFVNNTDSGAIIDEELLNATRTSGRVLSDTPVPATIALDPSKDVTLVSGAISQINDQSGNGNNASQSNASYRPLVTRSDNLENRIIFSEDYESAYWFKSAITVLNNQIANPIDGAITAGKFTASGGVTTHYCYPTSYFTAYTGIKYRACGFAKIGTANMTLQISWQSVCVVTFDLAGGTPTIDGDYAGGSVAARQIDLGNGWYYFEITATPTTGGGVCRPFLRKSNNTTFDGAAGDYIYFHGMVINSFNASSTYLKTTGLPILAGINSNPCMVLDGANDYFTTTVAVNPTGGLSGACFVRQAVLTQQPILTAYTTAATYRLLFTTLASGALTVVVYNGSTNYIGRITPAATIVINTNTVFSWTYDGGLLASSIKIFKNGVQVDTADNNNGAYTVPTAGDVLKIGTDGARYLNGYLGDVTFKNAGCWTEAERQAEEARLMDKYLDATSAPGADVILLPIEVETWDQWWTEEGWTTWADAIAAVGNSDFPTPNIVTGRAQWEVDYEEVLPPSYIALDWIRTLIGDDITLTPTIMTSTDGITWATYAGSSSVYSLSFRYVKYKLDFVSTLGSELVSLTQVTANVSLKTSEETQTISVSATTINTPNTGDVGTPVYFQQAYIAVTDIQISVQVATNYNGSNVPIPVYYLPGGANPTYCLVSLWKADGTRISGTVSLRIKGAITI